MGSLNATAVSSGRLIRAVELYFRRIWSLIPDLTREARVKGCVESFESHNHVASVIEYANDGIM
jgi:hypothetical protein